MAGFITNRAFLLNAKSEYILPFAGGTIIMSTSNLQSAAAVVSFPMYGNTAANVFSFSGDVFIGGDVTTANKMACWSADGKSYIRNNFSSNMIMVYTELAVKKE